MNPLELDKFNAKVADLAKKAWNEGYSKTRGYSTRKGDKANSVEYVRLMGWDGQAEDTKEAFVRAVEIVVREVAQLRAIEILEIVPKVEGSTE